MTASAGPGAPGPLYLVQVRWPGKISVIAGAATARVGLKYLIWEGLKSSAQG